MNFNLITVERLGQRLKGSKIGIHRSGVLNIYRETQDLMKIKEFSYCQFGRDPEEKDVEVWN